MRSRTIRQLQAGLFVRFARLAGAFRECTPYIAGEAFHTGFGPFFQALYENRKLVASAAKVRLLWRLQNLLVAAPSCRLDQPKFVTEALLDPLPESV